MKFNQNNVDNDDNEKQNRKMEIQEDESLKTTYSLETNETQKFGFQKRIWLR